MRRSDAFCGAFPEASPSPALEEALERAVDAGRTAWPSFAVDEDAFVRHLASRLAGGDPLAALAQRHASDLWLAFACAQGERKAVDAFVATHLAPVATYLGKVKAEALADDVRQILLERFLVGDGDAPPKILE